MRLPLSGVRSRTCICRMWSQRVRRYIYTPLNIITYMFKFGVMFTGTYQYLCDNFFETEYEFECVCVVVPLLMAETYFYLSWMKQGDARYFLSRASRQVWIPYSHVVSTKSSRKCANARIWTFGATNIVEFIDVRCWKYLGVLIDSRQSIRVQVDNLDIFLEFGNVWCGCNRLLRQPRAFVYRCCRGDFVS